MLNYLCDLGQHQQYTYPLARSYAVVTGLKVTNSAGLTELSFPYPGICPNLFLQLPEANPYLVYLLFKRTSNCAEISLGNLAWYHLHKLQVWCFFSGKNDSLLVHTLDQSCT